MITITKVVSSNIIMDLVAKFQNIIGRNLTTYEKMTYKAMEQIQQKLTEQDISLSWYRYEITQLTNGALCVTLYGERK